MLCVANWNANGMDIIKGKIFIAVLTDRSAELVDMIALTETGGMLNTQLLLGMTQMLNLGGYTACGIPLVRSANGNRNGIPFPFVSIKKVFESFISICFR